MSNDRKGFKPISEYINNTLLRQESKDNFFRIWDYINQTIDENLARHEQAIGIIERDKTDYTDFSRDMKITTNQIACLWKAIDDPVNGLKAELHRLTSVFNNNNGRLCQAEKDIIANANQFTQVCANIWQEIEKTKDQLNKLNLDVNKNDFNVWAKNQIVIDEAVPENKVFAFSGSEAITNARTKYSICVDGKRYEVKEPVYLRFVKLETDLNNRFDPKKSDFTVEGTEATRLKDGTYEYRVWVNHYGYLVSQAVHEHFKKLDERLVLAKEKYDRLLNDHKFLSGNHFKEIQKYSAALSKIDELEKRLAAEQKSRENDCKELERVIDAKNVSIGKLAQELEKVSKVPANKYWNIQTQLDSALKANESLKAEHNQMKQQYDKKYSDMIRNYESNLKSAMTMWREKALKAEAEVHTLKNAIKIVSGKEE